MTSDPLISVIIPAWNRARSIGAAIASVRGRYAGDFELIVVDDGSADGTAEAAEAAVRAAGLSDCARVLRQANAGPGAARNAGARAARGRWLAFLDSDDHWFDWTLQTCADVVAPLNEPALVFLQNIDVDAPSALTGVAEAPLRTEAFASFLAAVGKVTAERRPMRFASCNMAISRDAFLALGGFPVAFRCSEDSDLFLRADATCACVVVDAPALVAHHIDGGDSLSGNAPCVVEGFGRMLAHERAGEYPGGAGASPARIWFLAKSAVYAVRIAFAAGRPGLAYATLLRHVPLILRGGQGRWLWRLLLTPALGCVRPRSYAFRWRPPAPDLLKETRQ
jgi:GT2 family glycosyltransferase